ncbi:hypothetical protein J9332_43630, partial [Aquimarina celericrescens]|nr:hypothetical protein [Aquimarina celericrescens]
SFDYIELDSYTDEIEKKYILDLTSLAVWNDKELDKGELSFMSALGAELQLSNTTVEESIDLVKKFIDNHKNKISFFNYSHPAL